MIQKKTAKLTWQNSMLRNGVPHTCRQSADREKNVIAALYCI